MFDIYSPTTRKLLHLMLLSGAKTIEEMSCYIYGTDKFTVVDITKIGGKTIPSGSSYDSVTVSSFTETGSNKTNNIDMRLNQAPSSTGAWVSNNGKVGLYNDIPLEQGHTVKVNITAGDPSNYGLLSNRINKDGTAHGRRIDTTWPVVFEADEDDRIIRCSIYKISDTNFLIDDARNLNPVVTIDDGTEYCFGYKKKTSIPNIPVLSGINDVYDYVERGDDLKWRKSSIITSSDPKNFVWYKYGTRTDGKVIWGYSFSNIANNTRNIKWQYPVGTGSEVLYGGDACCCVNGKIVVVFDPDFSNETDLSSFKAQLTRIYYELNSASITDVTDKMYEIDYYNPTDTIEKVSDPTITYSYNTAGLQGRLVPKREIVKGSMNIDGTVYDNTSVSANNAIFAHYFPAGLSTITFSTQVYLSRMRINGCPVQIGKNLDTYTINIKEPQYIVFYVNKSSSLEELSVSFTQPYAYMLKSNFRNVKAETLNWAVKAESGSQGNVNRVYGFDSDIGQETSANLSLTGFTSSTIVGSMASQMQKYGSDADNLIYLLQQNKVRCFSSKATLAEFTEYITGKIYRYKATTRASVLDLTWNVETFNNIRLEPHGTLQLYNSYNTDIPVKYTISKDESFDFSACNMRWWKKIWYTDGGSVSASPDACATDFMPIGYYQTTSGFQRYMEFNIAGGLNYIYSRAIVFFDNNFNFIQRSYQAGQVMNYKTEVPANARFFRLQVSCGNTRGNMTQGYMSGYGITVQEYLEPEG